jgi:phosphate:Na+ symporter
MDFLLHGNTVNAFVMPVAMLAGLALFLLGMEQMSQALQALAGAGLRSLLSRVTANRFRALLTGATATALMQSSSITTVLMVGFVSAGAATLTQSLGFILGADIGSTVTAQMIAFKVTAWSLPMIVLGYFTRLLASRDALKFTGLMVLALGLVFFGLEIMAYAMEPLRSWEPFMGLMRDMDHPLLGIAIGAVFTALIQSSAAAMGIFIVLASQGFLTLEAGLGLVLGANIGTCATALLAAIGRPRQGVQVAVAHVLIKIIGVLIWLGFLEQLGVLARQVSPTRPELTGLARVAAELPRQLANAHTIFNAINSLVLI